MDRLLEICDEMASGSDYITLKDIVERFYGHKIAKVDGDVNYWNLKQKLNRDKDHVIFVEYKNGHDLRGGFRYKEGFEYYFRNKEKKATLNRLEGDERQLFLTGGLQMLFDGESSCEHLVELECVSELHNLGLVKRIVNYIQFKRVISFRYQKGYRDIIEVIIHPYLLKEFNSRWFLFGSIHQQNNTWEIVNIALDRIIYDEGTKQGINVKDNINYKDPPQNFNKTYFKDIVGVTRYADENLEMIKIRTVNYKVHHLLRTKPIHSSQKETKEFDSEKGYGEFSINVIPNIELQARILGYGPGLYILSGTSFHKQMKDAIDQMAKLYHIDCRITLLE